MPDKTTVKADEGSPPAFRPPFEDPVLMEEWTALENPEDRAEYLDALQTLAELEEEEFSSWEDGKAELGY